MDELILTDTENEYVTDESIMEEYDIIMTVEDGELLSIEEYR